MVVQHRRREGRFGAAWASLLVAATAGCGRPLPPPDVSAGPVDAGSHDAWPEPIDARWCTADAAPAQDTPADDVVAPQRFLQAVARLAAGERGAAYFGYDSRDAITGLYPWRPLAVGTHEVVEVWSLGLMPELNVRTLNPGVVVTSPPDLQQHCCDGDGLRCDLQSTAERCAPCQGSTYSVLRIAIATGAAGDGRLELRDRSGALFEGIELSVRAPAALRIDRTDFAPASRVTTLDLASADMTRLRALSYDATGALLESMYGVTVASSAPSVVAVREPGFSLSGNPYVPSARSFDVEVLAGSRGAAVLAFSAGQSRAEVAVTVR